MRADKGYFHARMDVLHPFRQPDIAGGGSWPVAFVQGVPTSALSYSFVSLASLADDLEFSSDGGATWSYVPTPDANGADPAVTHLRVSPSGTFAAKTGPTAPSFTLRFRVRVD